MKYYLSIFFFVFVFVTSAQVPTTYYSSVDGLTGDALWTGLSTLIDNPNTVPYGQVDDKFVELGTDEDPNNSSNIIFFYMRDSRPSNSFTGNGNGSDSLGGWNKEHIWPRSRGVGRSGDDQQDMHMLRPTDVDVNSRRAALDFGLVSGNNTANGSYFEPHDEVKGDCARILFYMITAYKGSLELVENVTNKSRQLGNLSLMVQWHLDDPVDDFERNRNDIVYNYQGNSNPYVNHPEWINEIWGDGTGTEVLGIDISVGIKIYPNPVDDILAIEALDKSAEVRLFSSTGQRMIVKLIPEGIDVSDLEHGLYYLAIKSETGTQMQKVLIK